MSCTQILGPIGSVVLSFVGYKQTETQTRKVYIYRFLLFSFRWIFPVVGGKVMKIIRHLNLEIQSIINFYQKRLDFDFQE